MDLNFNENWACDKYEWTPLMYACDRGNIEMVKLLLANGADANVISQYPPKYSYPSTTALLVSLGYEELLQVLLGHGADVNLTDARGDTVLLARLPTRQAGYRRDDDVFNPD